MNVYTMVWNKQGHKGNGHHKCHICIWYLYGLVYWICILCTSQLNLQYCFISWLLCATHSVQNVKGLFVTPISFCELLSFTRQRTQVFVTWSCYGLWLLHWAGWCMRIWGLRHLRTIAANFFDLIKPGQQTYATKSGLCKCSLNWSQQDYVIMICSNRKSILLW